jgi:hypothetical protein
MVELAEDGTGTGNGLAVKFPNDNFTAIFNYPPDQQPLILGDRDAHGNARGEIIGWPTQTGLNARTADVMVQVAAMSGATVLRVTEHS